MTLTKKQLEAEKKLKQKQLEQEQINQIEAEKQKQLTTIQQNHNVQNNVNVEQNTIETVSQNNNVQNKVEQTNVKQTNDEQTHVDQTNILTQVMQIDKLPQQTTKITNDSPTKQTRPEPYTVKAAGKRASKTNTSLSDELMHYVFDHTPPFSHPKAKTTPPSFDIADDTEDTLRIAQEALQTARAKKLKTHEADIKASLPEGVAFFDTDEDDAWITSMADARSAKPHIARARVERAAPSFSHAVMELDDDVDSPAPSKGGNSKNIPVSIAPAVGVGGKSLAAHGGEKQGTLNFLAAATSNKPASALKNLAQHFSAPPSAFADPEHDTRQPKNTHTLATNTIALVEKFAQQHIPGFQNFQTEISSTCFVKETTTNVPETFFAFPPLNGGGKGTMTTQEITGKIKALTSSPNFKGGIVMVQSHKSILFSPPDSAIEFQKVMGGEPMVESLLALSSLSLTCTTLTPLDLLEVGLITKELTPRRLNMTLYLLLPPTPTPSPPRHVFVEVFEDELHPHTPIPPTH